MKNDPLSPAQYAQIKAFADSCLLDDAAHPKLTGQGHLEVGRALSKDHMDDSHPDLKQARAALGDAGYAALRGALSDPRRFAAQLSIDPHDPRQLYAARQYLKVAAKTRPMHYDKENIDLAYNLKMTGGYRDEDILPKHALLMRGDPAQGKSSAAAPHPVDVVLQNCHFEVPADIQTSTRFGAPSSVEKTRRPEREHVRDVLRAGVHALHAIPHTRLVLEALAALMQQEKGTVIFTRSPTGVGNFVRKRHGVSSNMLGGVGGVYLNHHTVYNTALVNPFDGRPSCDAMATFVHEVQHMLFARIVANGASPVETGSAEERALDEALANDRTHREHVVPHTLSEGAQRFRSSLVSSLEDARYYFGGSDYDPTNAQHQVTMRTEAIVRPLECIAAGATPADIEAVAPHLWQFLQTHALPRLAAYRDAAIRDGVLGPSDTRPAPTPQFTGEKVRLTKREVPAPRPPIETTPSPLPGHDAPKPLKRPVSFGRRLLRAVISAPLRATARVLRTKLWPRPA